MNKRNIISILVLAVIVAIVVIVLPKGNKNTIEVGNKQSLTWVSSDIASSHVVVNIIKKVGENPDRYELVRVVSDKTQNDGTATWIPAKTDVNDNIFIEIGCAVTDNECHAEIISSDLVVIDSNRYQNTASLYDSIERTENN